MSSSIDSLENVPHGLQTARHGSGYITQKMLKPEQKTYHLPRLVLDYVEQPADTLPATAEDDRKGRTKAANRFLQPQLARNPVKQSSRYLPQGMRAKPRVGGDSVVLNSRNVRLLNESPHQ